MKMNNELKYALVFLSGAAVGAAVSWKLLKTKYEQIAQEEIDSVKEVFSRRNKEETKPEEIVEEEDEEESEEEEYDDSEYFIYEDMLEAEGYTPVEKGDDEDLNYPDPYRIPPEEFGEGEFGKDNYETVSLTYYEDGVVEDEDGNVLEDDEIERLIGKDSLNHFGEYEDDSVFVRNDNTKRDYEILRDYRKYVDIM